ncbi:MAG TPA: FAD-dependent oxidoreductase, partial [Chitinophagaceae bacterium]|nr:FAD-dependent oxidoreductase [Chitinophagaceae bacterium]
EKDGGQIVLTSEVENYPGYADGVMGPKMMQDFEAQARRMGADIRWGMATKVDFSLRPYRVEIDEETWIEADSIIISTGASAKWLGIPEEERLATTGGGVSACAVCDGAFFKGKEVAIVGAGDTACEEAIYLSKLCSKVHMMIRSEKMRASKVMQDRVLATENIQVYWNTVIDSIEADEKIKALNLKHNADGSITHIDVSALFVAIGHQPNSDIFKPFITMDETGYILTQPGSTKTNLEGVFASGDVQDKIYRQAVTAAGSGCMAALDAERYLSENGLH